MTEVGECSHYPYRRESDATAAGVGNANLADCFRLKTAIATAMVDSPRRQRHGGDGNDGRGETGRKD